MTDRPGTVATHGAERVAGNVAVLPAQSDEVADEEPDASAVLLRLLLALRQHAAAKRFYQHVMHHYQGLELQNQQL
jgi:hypothetical protein